MAGSVNWNGKNIEKQIKREMHNRLEHCATMVQGHARDLINIEGTGIRTRRVRDKSGRLRKSKKLVYGANPSKPGEPPRKQTGRLYASVAWDFKDYLVSRVGTNVPYGKFLEFGTAIMAARPWLHRALREKQRQINELLSRPIK